MKSAIEFENIAQPIIKNFDFKTVHRIMVLLDWKWNFQNNVSKVPSIQDCKTQVYELIKRVYYDDLDFIATGGFRVIRYGVSIELIFVLRESEYLSDDEDFLNG